MAVQYRDPDPLSDSDKNSIVALAGAIRTKMYGKDVREAIASSLEKVSTDRSDYIATPKGVYDNLTTLQKAFPNGTTGVYITADDGHWHIYNYETGVWQDGGTYQSTLAGKNSVANTALKGGITSEKVDYLNLSSINNNYLQLAMAEMPNGNYIDRDSYMHSNSISDARIGANFGNDGSGLYIPFDLLGDTDDLTFYITHNISKTDSDVSGGSTLTISFANKSYSVLSTILTAKSTVNSVELVKQIKNSDIPSSATGIYLTESIGCNGMFYLWLYNSKFERENLTNYMLRTQGRLDGGKSFVDIVSLWNTSKGKIVNNDYFCHYIADPTVANTSNAGVLIRGKVDPTRDAYISITGSFLSTRTDNQTLDVFLCSSNGSTIVKDGKLIYVGELERKIIKTVQLKITPAQMKQYSITGVLYVGLGGKMSDIIVTDAQIGNEPFGEGISYAISKINPTNSGEEMLGIPLDLISDNDVQDIAGIEAGTPEAIVDVSAGYITEIQAYVSKAGAHTFYIGALDQNSLLVNQREVSIYLDEGLNQIDVSNQKIKINSGERLFIDLTNEKLFKSSDVMPAFGQGLIQDNSHHPTDANYSGDIFYLNDLIVPLAYKVENINYLDANKDIQDSVDNLNNKVVDLSKQSKSVITSPNGNKFRLTVADDGSLTTVKIDPAVVRVFGNSLTTHQALQGVGMAASSMSNDFADIFFNYAKSANSNSDGQKFSLSDWESKTNSADRKTFTTNHILPNLPEDTDYVVLQLGDNINSDAKFSTFRGDIKSLISDVKNKAPHAQVYVVGSWFRSYPDITTYEQNACKQLGATFVYITDLYTDVNKSKIGNKISLPDGTIYTVQDNGVAMHPGDLGHKAIADRLISKLDF